MYRRANEVRTGGAQMRCGQPAISSTSDAQPDSGQHAPWTLPFAMAPDPAPPAAAVREGTIACCPYESSDSASSFGSSFSCSSSRLTM